MACAPARLSQARPHRIQPETFSFPAFFETGTARSVTTRPWAFPQKLVTPLTFGLARQHRHPSCPPTPALPAARPKESPPRHTTEVHLTPLTGRSRISLGTACTLHTGTHQPGCHPPGHRHSRRPRADPTLAAVSTIDGALGRRDLPAVGVIRLSPATPHCASLHQLWPIFDREGWPGEA